MLNFFDAILYINLPHRNDRKTLLEHELDRVFPNFGKIKRIEAFYDELNGTRGCVYSHILALNYALEKSCERVLILEDDCSFVKAEEIHRYIADFLESFQNNWDVFFLGTKVKCAEPTHHPAYQRVLSSIRAHAYAVNRHYLNTLRDHFLAIYQSMENDLFFLDSLPKALDRQWISLQTKDRWFAGIDSVAEQRESFSDIEKAFKSQR